MKKRKKLITLGVLTATAFYSCSPMLTLAVTEEQSSTVQSSDSLKEDNFSIDQFSSTENSESSTIIENETSSNKGATTDSSESGNQYVTADISSFMNKDINLVPVSNSDIRFSESENGLVVIDNKNNLATQTFSFQATEDGWLNIQNNSTKNYLTIEENSTSLFFANLQESDNQKWHFVNEEHGTYYIESKTKQLLVITEENNLQVNNGEVKQRWSIEEPVQEESSIESSTIESTADTTNQSSDSFQIPKATSEDFNIIEKTAISKTQMKITIRNPNGGNVSNVKFPTWTRIAKPDDLKWINGTRNSDGSWSAIIDSKDFNRGGTFDTHIYGTVNGKDIGIGSTSYELEETPYNIIEKTAISKTQMKITIKNPNGGNVSNVKFPTWTRIAKPDDLKWINGTRDSDGSWSAIIDSKDFNRGGTFDTHIYGTVNGKDIGIGSTSYELEETPYNIIEKTALSKTQMKITIKNPNGGNVSNVKFPTWTRIAKPDDLKWINGTRDSDGSWSAIIDSKDFKRGGTFDTHIYGTVNGKDIGIGSTSYELEETPYNIIEKTALSKTQMKITIKNPNGGNVSNVKFPTWTRIAKPDDLKWINGTRNSDGSWSAIIDSKDFNRGGTFDTHIYGTVNGKDIGIGSTSYELEEAPNNIIEKVAISKTQMKITIKRPNGGNVTNVKFPTWTRIAKPDDLKWINGTRNSDGSWSAIIDSKDFNRGGTFDTHIYGTVNGKDIGIGSTSYELEEAPNNIIEKVAISKTQMKITIKRPNGGNVTNVKFPTWTRITKPDDLKWINGTRNSDGSWSATIDSKDFNRGGTFDTHIYGTVNGKDIGIGSTSYTLERDDAAIRLSKKPYYYSQLDGRWSNARYGAYTFGPSGCVPTSMAMVLRGHFGINVSPIDTANRIYGYGGFNQRYFGASGIDFVKGMNSYGKTVVNINSLSQLNDYLSKGYPVVMFVNVGIGHAVVAHGYSSGGYTTVYDPYGKQFYNGTVATGTLWSTPSNDSIDWSAGRPYFAIK